VVTAAPLDQQSPGFEPESLRARLRREVQLDVGEAVRIASQVADALTCAHAAGVIKRFFQFGPATQRALSLPLRADTPYVKY